jgi:hypothetical protein
MPDNREVEIGDVDVPGSDPGAMVWGGFEV